MVPNGEIADAGWALARLNDADNLSATSYTYQETTNPVRLYLIDTAINPAAAYTYWFRRNPKLAITTKVRVGAGKPRAFQHGTKMLSMIAGPETGAAQGTPIQAVIYDVYEGATEAAATTDSANLSMALGQARIHHLSANPRIPGVVCIASGSSTPEVSGMLQSSINSAVAAGLTVVVSAGNLDKDVALGYIPAVYGTAPGVICVGATGMNNEKYPTSNWGEPLDLSAPGENVRTLNYVKPVPGAYDLMSGTSPSAALTTAVALIELSKDPSLTPAQVEEKLTTAAAPSEENVIVDEEGGIAH